MDFWLEGMLGLLNGPQACVGFGQAQWREGGEAFGQEVLRWWGVKRHEPKATNKTHFLELSSLVHSIHTFFVIFKFIDNRATSIQVLLVVFLMAL